MFLFYERKLFVFSLFASAGENRPSNMTYVNMPVVHKHIHFDPVACDQQWLSCQQSNGISLLLTTSIQMQIGVRQHAYTKRTVLLLFCVAWLGLCDRVRVFTLSCKGLPRLAISKPNKCNRLLKLRT